MNINGDIKVGDTGKTLNNLVESNYYSTTEKIVGKWVDNRPVYKKTISIPNFSTTAVSINTGMSNVDLIINYEGGFYRQGIARLYSIDNMFMSEWGFNKSTNSLNISTNNQYVSFEGYITLYYIKTTD